MTQHHMMISHNFCLEKIMTFHHMILWWLSIILWLSIIWWLCIIKNDLLAPQRACRPVRVQTYLIFGANATNGVSVKILKWEEFFPYLTRKEPLWNIVECVLFDIVCNFTHSVHSRKKVGTWEPGSKSIFGPN